jgi:conjugal transfer/entry exclusion protein
MKAIHAALRVAALTTVTFGAAALPLQPAAAQVSVFDPTNYAQNLLQAARALEQINNQVKSLQNEASMLQNMAKNLEKIDFPQLQRITSAMQIHTLFPGTLSQTLTSDQRIAEARARLDAASDAYRQAMGVQAQVAENVKEDAGVLNELAASSQGAVGALQVSQAANQLLALGVKQQLQLQNLMASEYREAAIERARRAQAEEDGKAMTRRFLDGRPSN